MTLCPKTEDPDHLLICEPICCGMEHTMYNAGMIEVMARALPSSTIQLFGEKDHLRRLKDRFAPEVGIRVAARDIALPQRRHTFFQRFFQDLGGFYHVFKKADALGKSRVVFLSSNASTLIAIKILIRFFFRKLRVQAVLHSGLAKISGWRSRNPFVRMLDFQSALTCLSGAGIHYIVLEKSIGQEMLKRLPELQSRVWVLEHPLPGVKNDRTDPPLLGYPLRIGFVGNVSEGKGFPLFVRAARHIRGIYGTRLVFDCIGSLGPDTPDLDLSALETKPETGKLETPRFEAGIRPLHYICLPYDPVHYKWSASGILLDAVYWEKPIIARALPYIRDLFKAAGNIGYLFEDEAQFYRILEMIAENCSGDRYLEQVMNLRRVKAARSPDRLSQAYLAIGVP